ncbi:MAG TPA: hypothetical protein VFK85_09805 [Anaeromyxobacteraceae bacterium]|nr:hypothetical protein [Anaeromyxobacteraceae bacterium]
MRTLLVPALAALLALPAFASAAAPGSAYDDASYGASARTTIAVAQVDRASSSFDDSGLALPEATPAAAAAPVRVAVTNAFDDAGLMPPDVAPSAPAPVRVAERTTAPCTCCQS